MKDYSFKKKKLPSSDEIWLEEIYNSKSPKINKRDIKVRLKNTLPKNYNPDNIDKRYFKEDRLTLLGIWYFDHNNLIIPKVEVVLKEIQAILDMDSSINLFESKTICELTKIEEEEVKYIFQIILDLELFSGYKIKQGDAFPCGVSFSENHGGFDKVLYFNNIYETLDEFYNERKPFEESFSLGIKPDEFKSKGNLEINQFVDSSRIIELKNIKNEKYDLGRLIQLCKEMNDATEKKSFLSIAMITRTIINHVPPIFQCDNFSKVVNNYPWEKSHKKLMKRLEDSLKNVADSHLHKQISNVESLPTFQQVDYRSEIDVLLSEIILVLKGKKIKMLNVATKLEITKTKQTINKSERNNFKLVDGAYFLKEVEEGSIDGPYCTRCYDVDKKLVILTTLRPPFDDIAKYQCQNCKGLF